jgi:hypothetical protein
MEFSANTSELRGLALDEAQAPPEREDLQHVVVVAAREDVGETGDEGEGHLEGEERRRQAPLVVWGIGTSSVPRHHVAWRFSAR